MTKSFTYKPSCSIPKCDERSVVKGFCKRHYQESKQAEYRALGKGSCATSGCQEETVRGNLFCASCKQKVGSEKAASRNRKNARVAYEESKPDCAVPSCVVKVVAKLPTAALHRKTFCERHANDMIRKSMGLSEYTNFMSAESCEACGHSGPLVTDHDHSCHNHTSKNAMCAECVRGRLCSPCNTSLGSLGEDPERIMGLALYAKRISVRV